MVSLIKNPEVVLFIFLSSFYMKQTVTGEDYSLIGTDANIRFDNQPRLKLPK